MLDVNRQHGDPIRFYLGRVSVIHLYITYADAAPDKGENVPKSHGSQITCHDFVHKLNDIIWILDSCAARNVNTIHKAHVRWRCEVLDACRHVGVTLVDYDG